MRINDQDWNIWDVVRGLYPFQLIITHIKHNLISILFWIALFLIVFDRLGYSFGIPYLFLSPEYMGKVSPISFLLVGFSVGGFIMGFNTYSYIKLGPQYPFLTTIAKPFLKFCVNNALIPILFVIAHTIGIINFQSNEEFASLGEVFLYILSYISGITLFITLSFIYFFPIARKTKSYQIHSSKPITSAIYKREKWYDIFKRQKDRTYIYIGRRFRLMPSRSSKHFDKELVEQIYAKNRINASIFEILTITLFFGLGLFSNFNAFEVPAAFSIVLLMTIFQMLFSALQSWLRAWVYPVLIGVILLMNYLSTNSQLFNYTSYAFGLNYDKTTNYSVADVKELASDTLLSDASYQNYLSILNNWKKKTGEDKPKLVILNTSGGGSRSALWTITVLQHLDSLSKGELTNHLHFISGASGGMIGAAYYRQLLLEHNTGKLANHNHPKYAGNIGKDMLNRLAFMASTNDIFIRYQRCYVEGNKYVKDRGYAFEQQLNINTEEKLNHNLAYYKKHEKNATIPVMLFTPTIVNDGRRLMIGSQSFHFLSNSPKEENAVYNSYENVDYHGLFQNQERDKLKFTSVLRASATFPFVMPMITLPTQPQIQLMDAGIRDNYGGKSTMELLHTFQDWINENTSGVIILQVRDTKKVMEGEAHAQVSFMDKITLPFGNMYKNFPRVQDFNQDELMKIGSKSFDFDFDVISFNLLERKNERISLSWHLTTQEKKKIKNALRSDNNQQARMKTLKLLSNKKGASN